MGSGTQHNRLHNILVYKVYIETPPIVSPLGGVYAQIRFLMEIPLADCLQTIDITVFFQVL